MVYCTVTNDLNQDRRMRRIGELTVKNGWSFTLIGREKRRSPALTEAPFEQRRLFCLFQKGPLFYFEFNLRLLIALIKSRPQVVYSVDLDTICAGVIYKKLLGSKLIFDAHEYFEEVPELIGRPFIKWIWKRIGQWGIPQADLAITVGEALAEELERNYKVVFKVIRNTRNRPKSAITPKKFSLPFRMVYLGMLNPGRGLEELIKALSQLENCELWLAGSGPLKQSLRNLAHENKVSHRVIFSDFLTGQLIEDFLASGHLGCNLLNPKSKSYYYSLANKTFDYMQFGIPAIHMNLPEYRAINQKFDCLTLLDQLSVPALVEKVQDLMKDPSRYEMLSKNSLIASEEYLWDREKTLLIEELRKLNAPETTST